MVGAMPTMGLLRLMPPADPKNPADPKLKMPPSDATSQYPPSLPLCAMPTMGLFSGDPERSP